LFLLQILIAPTAQQLLYIQGISASCYEVKTRFFGSISEPVHEITFDGSDKNQL
jgi:hypothetical protein